MQKFKTVVDVPGLAIFDASYPELGDVIFAMVDDHSYEFQVQYIRDNGDIVAIPVDPSQLKRTDNGEEFGVVVLRPRFEFDFSSHVEED